MKSSLKFSHKIMGTASLVVIAAFAAFTLYTDAYQRQALEKSIAQNLDEAGRTNASNIQNWLLGRVAAIETMLQGVELNPSRASIDGHLSGKTVGELFSLRSMGTASGEFITSPTSEMPEGYDPRSRPWYTNAVVTGGTTITEPYLDMVTKTLVLSIMAPVHSQGQLVGVGGGDLSLDAMVKAVNSIDLGGLGYAFLISSDGKVLVSPIPSQVNKSLSEIYPGHTPSLTQDLNTVELEGRNRLIHFTKITGLPSVDWYLGLSIDEEKAFEPLRNFRITAVVAIGITVLATIVLLGILIQYLLVPLRGITSAMQDIAAGEGDLTRRLPVKANDEFGQLAQAFNQFVERVHGSIQDVAAATKDLYQVRQEVLDTSNHSMQNTDEQTQRTTSVAAAINELGAAANEIARNASEASRQASSAKSKTRDGQEVVEHTIQAMGSLSETIQSSCSAIESLNGRTADIGQILAVIRGISEQTNLLALNAAIEAARAGEAGRGFAVVADEVRGLAHRAQKSTEEIENMIKELQLEASAAATMMIKSQQGSSDSVEAVNRAGSHFSSVTSRISDIDGMNQSVAAATEEQTAVVEALNVDISHISELNRTAVRNLQATLDACSALDQQTDRLIKLVGGFKI